MDTTTSMKALLVAMQQYEGGRNSHSAAQLLKQVEEVSALKCDHLLSSGQLLHTECVRGLVELTGNVNTCPNVAGAILSLLSQLACDDNSRTMLHYNFNLTSVLALLIHRLRATPGDPLVLQSLQLLQKLTYSTHNFPSTSYLHEFIAFLMTNIQSQSDEVVMPYLGLMANLCRDNQAVQNHVKSLDNVKPFYRTLINFLAHNNLTLVMFSLSILASLTLSENAGEKVFGAKNIHQTFQLVFNIILNCDGTLTRKYSADLLVDLLHNPKIADCLTRFQYFSVCASQLFGLLKSKDIDSAAKVLELLLAMCCVSGLRPLLCQVLFKPVGPKLRVASRRQAAGLEHKAESTLALVHWLSLPMGDAEACSLQVLQLIKELLEEALSAVSMPEGVHVFLEMLLPVILDFVKGLDVPANDAHLRQHCERIIHVNRVLLVLCGDDTTRALVSHRVSSQLCLSQVEMLLACCHGNSLLAWLPPGADHSLSQVCAEALLSTLELMSKLRQQVSDMETSFYRTLQDQRIATPLALALTSHQREHVRTGFALLLEAMPLPDFPSLVLSESVATNNAYRQSEAKLCVKRVPVQDVQPPCMNASQMDVSTSSSSVHSLVEKLHSAMELQEQAKDGHVSDIIDVYEHKLAALASEESRLQDLLEAKAVALSQADRLLAQHHFQRAQAEAEARKLASLLKEAERRRESLQAELVVQLEEAQRSKAETEELLQHNSRLQLASEEHQALKDTYNSLLHKFNEGECLLKKLQTAHATLNQTNQALRKNHQVLQLQHDKTVLLLQDKEEEITSLRSDMRLKDDDIAALRGDLREAEDKGREKELQKQELEDTLDALRKELSKTEQARKDASIKASSLQLQKSQLEAKLKQREDELNEHSAMIAMIHSMSSGKKKDVNFSL
ncbi:protein CIP2A isoform X2 [Syngnathoides biaculeatus]|uniref:protein CIP2A isoform X2 n=1 Tax=Syngnathoides biaculeatus TaxID=300417 RepID=UPI002ADE56AD|nr:protein CIP2A isoform X2 [Syngnathoides biaculeatus]